MGSSSTRKLAVVATVQRDLDGSSTTGSSESSSKTASVTGIKRLSDSNTRGPSGSERGRQAASQNQNADKTSETGVGLSDKELDMELVRRVQRGDKTGFDLLVLRYQNKILNLVSRYVHDSHEAQDVAQEAFIKAYRGLANFRGDSAFYTWLYRIAINTAKNHLITASRKISADGPDAQEAEQFDGAHGLRDYESPERSALNEEIMGVVERSIADLPEDLRTALTLREFEGLSYEEIANVMECPIGTVRSRIFRAREAIDTHLDPLLDESSRSLI